MTLVEHGLPTRTILRPPFLLSLRHIHLSGRTILNDASSTFFFELHQFCPALDTISVAQAPSHDDTASASTSDGASPQWQETRWMGRARLDGGILHLEDCVIDYENPKAMTLSTKINFKIGIKLGSHTHSVRLRLAGQSPQKIAPF